MDNLVGQLQDIFEGPIVGPIRPTSHPYSNEY